MDPHMQFQGRRMHASVIDWDRIEGFIGYGARKAPVVFVGMEEGAEPNDDLRSWLARRSLLDSIVELTPQVRTQRTWRPMCDLMLRREGNSAPSLADRQRYQFERLGRATSDTLLTELMPYPSNSMRVWPYKEFGRYADRESYMRDCLARRIELLRATLSLAPRDLIVCYGKGHWPHFRKLFDGPWVATGEFEIGKFGASRVVLAPHFSGRAFNSEEQLRAFAAIALG